MKIIYGIYKKVYKYREEGMSGNDIFLRLVEDYKPYMTKKNNMKSLRIVKQAGFINVVFENKIDGTYVSSKIKV